MISKTIFLTRFDRERHGDIERSIFCKIYGLAYLNCLLVQVNNKYYWTLDLNDASYFYPSGLDKIKNRTRTSYKRNSLYKPIKLVRILSIKERQYNHENRILFFSVFGLIPLRQRDLCR